MKLAAGQLKADEGLRPGGGSSPQLSGNQQLARGGWVSAGPSGAAEKNFGTNVVVYFANHLKFFHRHSGTSLLDVSAFWKS